MNKLSKLYHTVKHLKARQIIGQIGNRRRSQLEDSNRIVSQTVPAFVGCRWPLDVDILPPGMQANRATDILVGRLSFLNNAQNVGWFPDWEVKNLPKLWQYNVHYFEWLWPLDYGDARAVVLDWIEKHRPVRGAVGWEPYPTSLRLMNWCAVFWGRFREQVEGDRAFLEKLWCSICWQVQWLTRHLEVHLLGNHYFENGAALAFVGSCFKGEQASKWFEKGYCILREQIAEQILPDGMHFELSPMYHCRVVYVLAMLMATGNEQLIQLVAEPLGRMLKALDVVCHPDGRIALLNDSAFGIYNEPDELRSFCCGLPSVAPLAPSMTEVCFALPDAGYYGWRDGEGNYVICDFGKIGPDYIPGHAHADIFSFELSLKGHRVIVDSGVFDYEVSPTRQYCRSTKAHNTIEIENWDQCEMWGAFRVARRGRPHDVKWLPDKNGGFQLGSWHDGYKRLKGKPIHHRRFSWNESGKLSVIDKIAASKTQNMVSRLHLHPNCKIDQLKDNFANIAYPAGKIKITFSGDGKLSLEDSYYCPEFGVKIGNKALAFSFSGSNIETKFQIEAL